ncbi:MAG: aspartate aminotransferase family protein [Chloroflexota bacterium]|nr:aspartate aminotransferase family protein [Chloroflexota bacterium]
MDTEGLYAEYVNTSFVKSVEPVVVDRALGATIYAADGTECLDLFAGISVVNVGHCNPRVVTAAREQMERLIHAASYVYHVPAVGQLAEKLAEITPGRLKKTFFCNSGAEAVEGAMRLAKAYTGRSEFVALQASFHGRTNATLSVTGNSARKTRGGPYLPGVAFAPAPNPYRCRFCSGCCTLACADSVEDVFKYQTSGDVAAFIAEPVMGEGGIIVPHSDYFRRVKEILDRYGALFIADEVQSGFGRTGAMFAIEHYGVEPDIIAMAKGIANGFPLGAFTAPPEVADSFRPGEHLSTFGGNPVSCAAGLATIEVLQEDRLPERAAELGSWCKAALEELARNLPLIGDIRGIGLMIGVELVLDRETRQPAPSEAAEVRRYCRERGVLVGVGGQDGNVVRIQPPLVIEREDLERALDVLGGALQAVAVSSAGAAH